MGVSLNCSIYYNFLRQLRRTPLWRSSQDAPSGYFFEQSPARCERFLRVPSWRSDGQVFPTRPKGVFVSVELRMLTFSVVLGIVQIIAASHAASLQRGYKWTASSRDEKVEPYVVWPVAWIGRCATSWRPSLCSRPSSWWRTSRTPTTRSPSGEHGCTFGVVWPTCSCTRPGSR